MQLLPEHLQLDPRLRRSVRSHDFAVQIPRSNLVSHKRSFVPSAARIWNSLPEYIPSLEKRACLKRRWTAILATTSQRYIWLCTWYFCVLLLMPWCASDINKKKKKKKAWFILYFDIQKVIHISFAVCSNTKYRQTLEMSEETGCNAVSLHIQIPVI